MISRVRIGAATAGICAAALLGTSVVPAEATATGHQAAIRANHDPAPPVQVTEGLVSLVKEVAAGKDLHKMTVGDLLAKVPGGVKISASADVAPHKDKTLGEVIKSLPAQYQALGKVVDQLTQLARDIAGKAVKAGVQVKPVKGKVDIKAGVQGQAGAPQWSQRRADPKPNHMVSHAATNLGSNMLGLLTSAGNSIQKSASWIVYHFAHGLANWSKTIEQVLG